MNKKIKLILITITLIMSILLMNQLKYRNDELYAVNLKNKIDKDLVSILVSDGSENYTKYEGSTFPSNTEYTYNSELSKCQDSNGNVIEGILSYDETTGKVNIRTKKTTYCYLYFDKLSSSFAEEIIASGELWQSGLEGDGYRYTGTGITCLYNEGNHFEVANSQNTTPICPTLYNYTKTMISNGKTTNSTYQSRCPSNTSLFTYECTEVNGTINTESIKNVPNNFICFGTTSLSECKANESKYMYRIIGVFPDDVGEQHAKLIKYKQLPETYTWHSNFDISWEQSNLYKGLNGISGGNYSNLFIGNTDYDYLQDDTWLNKIVDWKWTATNTLTISDSGPDYGSITTEQMYLHEMNRSTKANTVGEWTYPETKIGLMYASDYMMSLGSSSLTMTSSSNKTTLKTGWLHPSNNDTTASTSEWFMSRHGHVYQGRFDALGVNYQGYLGSSLVSSESGVSPVFYLDSTVTSFDGNGSYIDPYLIAE